MEHYIFMLQFRHIHVQYKLAYKSYTVPLAVLKLYGLETHHVRWQIQLQLLLLLHEALEKIRITPVNCMSDVFGKYMEENFSYVMRL